jgi:hypothetical protein
MCDADGTGASALIFQNETEKRSEKWQKKMKKVL